jgi:hypothetical protein
LQVHLLLSKRNRALHAEKRQWRQLHQHRFHSWPQTQRWSDVVQCFESCCDQCFQEHGGRVCEGQHSFQQCLPCCWDGDWIVSRNLLLFFFEILLGACADLNRLIGLNCSSGSQRMRRFSWRLYRLVAVARRRMLETLARFWRVRSPNS